MWCCFQRKRIRGELAVSFMDANPPKNEPGPRDSRPPPQPGVTWKLPRRTRGTRRPTIKNWHIHTKLGCLFISQVYPNKRNFHLCVPQNIALIAAGNNHVKLYSRAVWDELSLSSLGWAFSKQRVATRSEWFSPSSYINSLGFQTPLWEGKDIRTPTKTYPKHKTLARHFEKLGILKFDLSHSGRIALPEGLGLGFVTKQCFD